VTLPVIQSAKQKIFFLKGEEKRKTWLDMMESKDDVKRWPGKGVVEGERITVMLGI
jgi:6-phosphogluconolactonase/glucosamine-6-phosphate isomerase/deaminase